MNRAKQSFLLIKLNKLNEPSLNEKELNEPSRRTRLEELAENERHVTTMRKTYKRSSIVTSLFCCSIDRDQSCIFVTAEHTRIPGTEVNKYWLHSCTALHCTKNRRKRTMQDEDGHISYSLQRNALDHL